MKKQEKRSVETPMEGSQQYATSICNPKHQPSTPRHKFHAKRTELDGIKFASKKEAKRYQDLKHLQESGEVLFFLRQVPLHLPGNIRYVCDYLVFYADGSCEFEDVKGMKTEQYITKKKIVEDIYPIQIREI